MPPRSPEDFARWGRWVTSTAPVFAGLLRWLALRALERHSGSPDAIRPLVAALGTPEPAAARADRALRGLREPAAVDTLCRIWAERRDPRLGEIVESCRYGAREPLEVRMLSCLKADRLGDLAGAEGPEVRVLVAALEDRDPTIRTRAEKALRALTRPAAVDGLIDLVLEGKGGERLVRIVEETGHQHSAEGRTFLYLVLVGRMEDYLGADHEFEVLRAEFQAAPAELQARVREAIVHSGNVRMNGLFVVPRREMVLGDLTDADADLLVKVNARNRNWDALFRFLWVLPARHIARAVRAMVADCWQPQDPDRGELLAQLAVLVGEIGGVPDRVVGASILGPVLEGWLARGEAPERAGDSEESLRHLLAREACPADQVLALGALRQRGRLGAGDLEVAGKSAHWPVRFVAAALGGRVFAADQGASLWFERLARVYAADRVWNGKPCELTREGLEAFQQGLAALADRRVAGGLLLVEAVYAHYTAHDIEIEVGAHVVLDEDSYEIEG